LALLRTFLYLFQVEEYVPFRFLLVVLRAPFPVNVEKVRTLDWTFKAKLLFVTSLFVFMVQILLSVLFQLLFWVVLVEVLIFLLFPWVYLIFSYYLLLPREVVNRCILKMLSRKKVRSMKLDGMSVIGITGSYGKTSTKVFVSKVLAEKNEVYATPKSHNTLFGIANARFSLGFVTSVLDHLEEKLDYFIVEMGAYCIGEVEELADAYLPDIGILTGITTMHYEKFGSLENTVKAKSELIDALPDKRKVFLNVSSKPVAEIYDREIKKGRLDLISYGFGKNVKYRARITGMTKDGTGFDLIYGQVEVPFRTQIIGTGNILNILAAIAVGIELGIKVRDIVKMVADLEQLESRMQIIDPGTGIVTINNGYSSNPESFKQSIETLQLFESHYKILVTPGIFELGNITYDVHFDLGKLIDENIDLVVLLGKKASNLGLAGLYDGMMKAGYPKDRIDYVREISACYDKITSRGLVPAVVIFENDLPDLYNI